MYVLFIVESKIQQQRHLNDLMTIPEQKKRNKPINTSDPAIVKKIARAYKRVLADSMHRTLRTASADPVPPGSHRGTAKPAGEEDRLVLSARLVHGL